MRQHHLWMALFTVLLIVCSGCAHKEATGPGVHAAGLQSVDADADPDMVSEAAMRPDPDPLAVWNRPVFRFNDTFYFAVLKPLASAYRELVPKAVRQALDHFFHNFSGPVRMINCLVQGKGQSAQAEWVRFWMNSTVGVLGFGNPAGRFDHLNPPQEDFGQSLAVWGIGEGWFVMWPILGPSNLRDTVGFAVDRWLGPVAYIADADAAAGLTVLETVNGASFRIGDYESMKDAAIEPYEAIRDAYNQYRKKQVAE